MKKLIIVMILVILLMMPVSCNTIETEPELEDDAHVNELAGSQWWAVSINGSEVTGNTLISLYLHNDGGVWGDSGCNQYFGNYYVKSPAIHISVGAHEIGCDEEIMEQEDTYFYSLQNTTSYSINGNFMKLYDASKQTLLVFERRPEYPMDPNDLIGTSWRLFSVDGEQVEEEKSGTLIFDDDGSSIHGQDGSFTYELSYDAWGDDIFNILGRTRRIRKPSGEYIFGPRSALKLIFRTVNYRLIDNRLEMYTAGGVTLVFKPLEGSDGG